MEPRFFVPISPHPLDLYISAIYNNYGYIAEIYLIPKGVLSDVTRGGMD